MTLGPCVSTKAAQQPQLSEQLDALYKLLYHLADQSDMLDERLGSITRNDTPDQDLKLGTVEQTLVPVAERVRSMKYRVQITCDRLASLRSRIEL